ncbi:hypothetical protein I6F36_35335 [Bradyrhizobium sp. BRP19]|uniref:WYL domain-containing protein n=1 Tax=unclassified Bradyrhizobium TaxID=2631580 RepID=UPI001CD2BCC8|nr:MULTISPECIES: WYL domain-containing protein [unclassified Bradyrhizobium]MCA1472981.1 hypothetical protein [Bradyrhizobium sp. IC3195]MCA1552070.1 hypothetical protein [Bradyrhizobium sp. BRP19]
MVSVFSDVRAYFQSKADNAPPPPIATAVNLAAPAADHGDEVVSRKSPGLIEHAEGQSFVLHYRDSDGHLSVRAVSVWAIRHTDYGVPVLVAKCHLRKATRYFRVDRIEAVADFNGVIIEPTTKFLNDTFGVVWPPSDEALVQADEFQRRWSRLRGICRENGGILLAAVGLADGELIPDEVGAILDYVKTCCARMKFEFGENEENRLRLYVGRLRPTAELIDREIERLTQDDPNRVVATLSACAKVMEADGDIHPAEIKVLDQFSREMTGLPLQYP